MSENERKMTQKLCQGQFCSRPPAEKVFTEDAQALGR